MQNSIRAVHYVADFAKPLREFFALSLSNAAQESLEAERARSAAAVTFGKKVSESKFRLAQKRTKRNSPDCYYWQRGFQFHFQIRTTTQSMTFYIIFFCGFLLVIWPVQWFHNPMIEKTRLHTYLLFIIIVRQIDYSNNWYFNAFKLYFEYLKRLILSTS